MTRPNILLVVLDSVRAKNTGLYGYHRETTPFLSAYSSNATVYEQARTSGIHSVASHASMWTGVHVESHNVIRHEDELESGTTIWESLTEEDYETGIFTTNPVVSHASNLAEPFDVSVIDSYEDTTSKLFPEAHGPADVVTHEGISGNLKRSFADDHTAKALLNSVHHFVKQQRDDLSESLTSPDLVDEFTEGQSSVDGPWAACINMMDAHFPYEPAPEHDQWGGEPLRELHAELDRPPANAFVQDRPWWQLEAFEHLYDGTIRELDTYVERIVTALKESGVHDETLVVITSDHGEGFGELSRINGRTRAVDHSWGIHEVVTHVPLVVKYPGQTSAERVDDPVSLAAFPDAVEAALDGVDRRDTFLSDRPVVSTTWRLRQEDDGIFEDSKEDPNDYYGPWRAVYEPAEEGVYKYAQHGEGDGATVQIRSAGDACRVGSGDPDRLQSAFEKIEASDVKKSDTGDLDTEVEETLTDLGYLR